MSRKSVTLALLAAPLLAPALASAQPAPVAGRGAPAPVVNYADLPVGRDPKGIVAPFNGTAEEAYVKETIRGAGYSGVNSLIRDSNGTWHARAYKGPLDVLVAVDGSGRITETAER